MDLSPVATYYRESLARHGTTARGVDWNSRESQDLRFRQLVRLWEGDEPPGEINDYGCGYGAFCGFLRDRGVGSGYSGFDLVGSMLDAARQAYAGDARARFVDHETALEPADVTVASGVFHVKLAAPEEAWWSYVCGRLDRLRDLSRRGFAFNLLTAYSDPEKRRPHLFYADPCEVFRYCRERFSPQVAVLHDYPLFEFTLLVRL